MVETISADALAAATGGFEPQRQSNWSFEVLLPGGSNNIALAIESANTPKWGVEALELHFANEVRYVAHKATYEAIPLRVKDFVDIPIAAQMYAWQLLVYNPETGAIGFAKDYKKEAAIILYGPDGSMQRRWTLRGCFPMGWDPGPLDMNSTEKVVMELTLRYDKSIPEL